MADISAIIKELHVAGAMVPIIYSFNYTITYYIIVYELSLEVCALG